MPNKFTLTKEKSIYIVDLVLIPIFILLLYSGLELHYAGHNTNHEIWEYWAEYHTIAGIFSFIAGWLHVQAHWNWYKNFIKKGFGKKSKVTLLISLLFLALIISGISLVLFIEGPNSSIGIWHYKLGLIITLLLIIHTIKRFPLIIKGLRFKKSIQKKNGSIKTSQNNAA